MRNEQSLEGILGRTVSEISHQKAYWKIKFGKTEKCLLHWSSSVAHFPVEDPSEILIGT